MQKTKFVSDRKRLSPPWASIRIFVSMRTTKIMISKFWEQKCEKWNMNESSWIKPKLNWTSSCKILSQQTLIDNSSLYDPDKTLKIMYKMTQISPCDAPHTPFLLDFMSSDIFCLSSIVPYEPLLLKKPIIRYIGKEKKGMPGK